MVTDKSANKDLAKWIDPVDWNDPLLKRWLDPIMKKGTKRNYRTAFRAYTLFTKMTASLLIDEALEQK